MIELYFSYDLNEEDLRESCEFTDEEIISGTQAQIDFILVANKCYQGLRLPHFLRTHLKGQYSIHNTSFRGEPKAVYVFWHD